VAADPLVRRRARECALQFLFGLDFSKNEWESGLPVYWEYWPAKPSVKKYAELLVRGVSENIGAIDAAITDALEKWSPDRVGRVEWNILRIACYEMKFASDVPGPVAINEAIEISKAYGNDEAPRFVNGVLDRLRKKQKTADSVDEADTGDVGEE
jgi:N utilization substance protein B